MTEAGFLIGPTLGIVVTRAGAELVAIGSPAESITIPLASMAILAALVALVVAFAVPNGQRADLSEKALVADVSGHQAPTKETP